MIYFLTAFLVLALLAAGLLYANVRMHKADADHFRNLFGAAQYQLGKVHDALSDIPKDAGTELGTVILRHKARALKTSNKVREAQIVLEEAEANNPETVRLVKELDKILA